MSSETSNPAWASPRGMRAVLVHWVAVATSNTEEVVTNVQSSYRGSATPS